MPPPSGPGRSARRPDLRRAVEPALADARSVAEHGSYVDTHCTVYTPVSFLAVFRDVIELGLIPFEIARIEPTQRNTIEFYVTLRKRSAASPAERAAATPRLDPSRTTLGRRAGARIRTAPHPGAADAAQGQHPLGHDALTSFTRACPRFVHASIFQTRLTPPSGSMHEAEPASTADHPSLVKSDEHLPFLGDHVAQSTPVSPR